MSAKSPFAAVNGGEDPTKDMTYERFRRICGIFDTIAPGEHQPAELAHLFGELRQQIETMFNGTNGATAADAADYVHNLSLLLVRIAPLTMLRSLMHANREDFREAVGDATYQRYIASEGYRALTEAGLSPETRDAYVRGDAIYVVNETRRQVLTQRHVEAVRAYLILSLKRGWMLVALPLLLVILGVLFLKALGDHHLAGASEEPAPVAPPPAETQPQELPAAQNPAATPAARSVVTTARPTPTPRPFHTSVAQALVNHQEGGRGSATPLQKAIYGFGILALAGLAGATGAFVSVLMRVLGVVGSSQVGRNIVQFQNSRTVVQMAPLSGAIFGVVISGLFAAGLVSGSVFPKLPDDYPWFYALYYHDELAKWLIWAFLSGFSERLVPDMLDRIVTRSQANEQRDQVGPNAPLAANGAVLEAEHRAITPGRIPSAPGGLTLAREGPEVRATWQAVPATASYRPWLQVEGRDADFIALPPITETTLMLSNLPVTGTVKFCVQAINPAGDSARSEVAERSLG